MGKHDRSYKQLFQHKILLEQLFSPHMLGSKWSRLLDFQHAELLPTELINQKLELRHTDQIWRIRRRDTTNNLYLLLMLEYQSNVEPKMALRISTYVTMMYEQLLRRKEIQLNEGLPPVLPMVLYRGVKEWHAHRRLSGLIQPSANPLLRYQPEQHYLLIEQRSWAKNRTLPRNNLTALLFLIEQCEQHAQAQQLLHELDRQSAAHADLRSSILAWLRYAHFPRVAPSLASHPYETFEEVHTMLELDPRYWWPAERLAGRREGIEEGKAEEKIRILTRLLETKYGPLTPEIKQCLQTATSEQLESWTLRILDAPSLAAIFR